jgi:putative membrane protein
MMQAGQVDEDAVGLSWERGVHAVSEGQDQSMLCGMMWGMGGGWMVLWAFVGVAVLVLGVLAVVWVVRNLASGGWVDGDPAEEELRRRYAAGEISRDQYRKMRSDLRIR